MFCLLKASKSFFVSFHILFLLNGCGREQTLEEKIDAEKQGVKQSEDHEENHSTAKAIEAQLAGYGEHHEKGSACRHEMEKQAKNFGDRQTEKIPAAAKSSG